jgi:hypothetical protein
VQVSNGCGQLAGRPETVPRPDSSGLLGDLNRVLDGTEAISHTRLLQARGYISEDPRVDDSAADDDDRDGEPHETPHKRWWRADGHRSRGTLP